MFAIAGAQLAGAGGCGTARRLRLCMRSETVRYLVTAQCHSVTQCAHFEETSEVGPALRLVNLWEVRDCESMMPWHRHARCAVDLDALHLPYGMCPCRCHSSALHIAAS